MSFSSVRHIPVYVEPDLSSPAAACSMGKARVLAEKYAAAFRSLNGTFCVVVASAEMLKSHVGTCLQMIQRDPVVHAAAAAPVVCHSPMNDREVMELMVRAAGLTTTFGAALSERAVVELSEIRHRLSDAIPGMTFPRPVGGVVGQKLNEMLMVFCQAQADKKLDDAQVIRKIQAFTW